MLKIVDHDPDDPAMHHHTLVHGATSHGLQFTAFPQSTWPTSYYSGSSGLGRAIRHLPAAQRRRIGLVGLGTGTIAIYGEDRGNVRIYEIDPQVVRIARTHFTYLER